jgi:hypothetical protein
VSDERRHVDVGRELTVSWGGSRPIVVSGGMGSASSAKSHAEAVEIKRLVALSEIDWALARLAERVEELRGAREAVQAWGPPGPEPEPARKRRGRARDEVAAAPEAPASPQA